MRIILEIEDPDSFKQALKFAHFILNDARNVKRYAATVLADRTSGARVDLEDAKNALTDVYEAIGGAGR